jgi:hypothetical protein
MRSRLQRRALIGLIGQKQSGKDTIYKLIEECLKGAITCERFAFADALKIEMANACGVTFDTIEQNKPIFRVGLQWWGTEFRRQMCGENYWLDRLADQLRDSAELRPQVGLRVITDCRFQNEAQFVTDRGGALVRVVRPGVCAAIDNHSSETDLANGKADYIIANSGTIEDLAKEVSVMLSWFGIPGTP